MSAQPEFTEVSPGIVGFDFNALSNAVGASHGVPDSNAESVVRHGDPSGEMGRLELSAPAQQPPQSHAELIPGYPWKGHPEIAYSRPFMGPDGTSPMHRSGPNVGAYAVAPGVPGTVNGAGSPFTVPGTYVPVPGQPHFAGYAGIDDAGSYGDAAARQARRTAPITVQGQNYVYKLFYGTNGMDGDIEIVVSGDPGVLPPGSIISRSSPRWSAIVREVGTWQDNKRQKSAAIVSAIASGLQAGAQAGRRPRRRRRRRFAPPPQVLPYQQQEEEEEGMPSWALPVGLGILGLIIVVSMSGGGKGR